MHTLWVPDLAGTPDLTVELRDMGTMFHSHFPDKDNKVQKNPEA